MRGFRRFLKVAGLAAIASGVILAWAGYWAAALGCLGVVVGVGLLLAMRTE